MRTKPLFLASVAFGVSWANAQTPAKAPQSGEQHTVTRHSATGVAARYATRTADLGPLGTRDVLDAPFSIMTVPHDLIVNQQSRNVNDLAAYMPSVQLEMRGDPNTSRPQSRGFEADVIANSRVDGLNMVITTPYAAEQFESLTVLNGLAGALYGPQNPAGTFDYRLKRPTDTTIARLSAGVDSNAAPFENLDLSGRKAWFGYRLNVVNQQGQAYVSGSHLRRALVSGDVDIHLSDDTVLQIDASQYSYAERGFAGQFSYGGATMLPGAPDLSRRGYGQAQGGYNAETNTALAKLIHHFGPDWTLTLGGLYQNAYRNVFSIANQLTDNAGDYTQRISAAATAKNFKLGSNTAYLNGRFMTGPIRHEVEIGSNGYTIGNYNPVAAQSFTLGKASLSDPRIVAGPQPSMWGAYKSADTTNQSLLAGDTLSFGTHWSLLGMVAWSWLSSNNYNSHAIKTATYSDAAAFSPTLSLIYKPAANQSLYATWGRAIQAGPVAPAGSLNAGNVLAPLRSEEEEIGYKIRLGRGLQLNAAGFRMTRPYAFTDPISHFYGIFGTQRNYGVEFQASGALTRDVSVFGGLTWMDAQLGKTGLPATSHQSVVGVPPVQADILIDWRVWCLPGAALNANVHYTGRRAANVTNTSFAAAYTTLDLGARYGFHLGQAPAVLRFGVRNVGNARYWASVYPSSINGGGSATNAAVAGLPRTYQGSVEVDF